jgi:hypothetical protein
LAEWSRALAWVLALALPFQALTAVYLDVRGPAHFHVEDDEHEHSHSHARNGIEHHHHHPHDHSVVAVNEHGIPDSPALEEEGRSGWSATMLVAATANDGWLQLLELSHGVMPTRPSSLPTHFPAPLERPPRVDPA